MNIAFDGQLFLKGNKTGIAWNAHNLISELLQHPENTYTIRCFGGGKALKKMHRLDAYRKAGCRVECCSRFSYTWYKFLWTVIPVPYRFFFRSDADITQFFNYIIPPGVRGKRIAMVHDMAYKSCPQTVNGKTRRWLEISMKRSCRRADHIITVSEFSKREIVQYLHISEKKITVIPNAVDHTVYHSGYTQAQIQKALDKYQIEKEYFLYLGTIEPRKNLERLIGAYEKLYRENADVPQLVLAGGKGWMCAGIYEKARRLNLGNKILFTGYVSQEDSPLLMCGAAAFVFPSLYEGFGMPPLEAMACAVPVIVSNTASLPEVAGDAGIYIDPENEDDICRAMRRILEDREYRERSARIGQQRAAGYTWSRSAEMLMQLYQEVSGQKKRQKAGWKTAEAVRRIWKADRYSK